MIKHTEISNEELRKLIKGRSIAMAGNERLKIYGELDCKSGKRMKKQNRVFFLTEEEAIKEGFRPCGNCLKERYKNWR
ncbi:MAG TPA: Ada metal-binding domain-containing protein [Flavitalea sp.]|nr:Ada metal-binding domain-containing protein [Flavitalea sp.]